MKKVLFTIGIVLVLQSCVDTKEYNLEKYYKDKNSQATLLMGGTYAGVVATFNSEAGCIHALRIAESNNLKIGYTTSIFKCTEK